MVKRILFVCSGNIHRSPTAANLFKDRKGFEVRSAGTSFGVLNPVDAELIQWADKIFVMEEEHREIIVRQYPEAASKITVLGVEDNYYRDDPQLKAILKEKLESYFNSH
ncbi:MAG: protein tyrosine phosphatase [Candidatus Bathyarchaeota archaeon]|nr:protein tyrosine phosphatase [Candidatus Bathyarchaeota archaeon]MDH5623832.1 protein tyrosine phosphatase [Candidatus Bathyarchaeota archaeon]MDH5635734.1 protein tyrosine phosphatase [Candidatus Bathyarchaeota archaeon]MDH5701479.1 protein tyrosine phosphatase [Candidatus Bathyarchaeota archaeon]